jgi:hypothetical protein
MASNTKKQNNKEKKIPTKKNNPSKEAGAGKDKPKKPVVVRPKLGKLPKTKLKPNYTKKCENDIGCIYNKEDFKPTLKNIYHKIKKFGFMVDVPNETPHSKKNFKVKCKGLKKPTIYEEPDIDKKRFGFLLPKLNSSLYVARQQNHNCYDTRKEKTRKNVPLGKLCYKDIECESKTCSNIKILKLPGRCIFPKNTGKIVEGKTCNYETDCKTNLTCVNKKCVKKPRSVLNTIAMKKIKKENKKKKQNPVRRFFKTKKSQSSSNTKPYRNLSNSDISDIKDNKNFYVNDKGKIDCKTDSFCKINNKDSYCYKNKCVLIHKRCKKNKKEDCLKNTNVNYETDCCDKNSKCVEKTTRTDGIDITDELCISRDNLKKGNIGNGCNKNTHCKSNYCSDVSKRCDVSPINGYINVIPCKENIDCINSKLGSADLVCNKKNICKKIDKIQNQSLEIFDTCSNDIQCKTNKCGKNNDKKPQSNSLSFVDNVCLGNPNETAERLKNIEKINYQNKEKIKNDIKENVTTLEEKLNDTNNKPLFIHSGIYDNSLVIIKDKNKLFLGKIIENVKSNIKTHKIYSKVIIYFDETTELNNFKNDYTKLNVICSDKHTLYYNYFSDKNNNNLKTVDIDKYSINLNNKFIFLYLCFILFGKRTIIHFPEYKSFDDNYYYIYQDNILDANKWEKNDDFLGIKDHKIGLYQSISVPFKFTDSKIRSVFTSYNKDTITNFIDLLKTSEYLNIDAINLENIELGYDNTRKIKIINDQLSDSRNDSINESIIKFNDITNTSIFKDVI